MKPQTRTEHDEPTLDEAQAFAHRHGLNSLKPEHIERLRQLIAPVAHFGQQVRRAAHKSDAPAPEFTVFKP